MGDNLMSEINVDTIKNAAGTREFFPCTAWVNFNGTLAAGDMIRGSGNVSSITDNGTGNYTINFATAMTNADYSLVGGGGIIVAGGTGQSLHLVAKMISAGVYDLKTVNGITLYALTPAFVLTDNTDFHVQIFGN